MNEKEIAERITKKIDGFLAIDEGKFLFECAKNCKGKGVIVEIGSWKGKSTIWLGKGSKAGKKVKIYAIDPHTGSPEHKKKHSSVWTFDEFKQNIKNAKIDDIILPIVKTSEAAAKTFKKPVEFIFIDGAHEYEMVKLDYDLWFPKLIDGGIIAFHDTVHWKGPKKLMREIMSSRYFKNIGFVHSLCYAEKTKQNSLKDRLRNKIILLKKDIYEVCSNLYLPGSIRKIGKKVFWK